jgi:hypothetical protein
VVLAAEVNKRTAADPRIAALQGGIAEASENGTGAALLRAKLASVRPGVPAEMPGQVADEFADVRSVERAHSVGSVLAIVPAARLRPYLIGAVQRGMHRTLTPTRASKPRPGLRSALADRSSP